MKAIFVLGTDTEVGKTSISSGLIKLMVGDGIKVGVMKPFASGKQIHSKKYRSQDTKILANSADVQDNDEILNPYFYKIPSAPFLAVLASKGKEPDLKYVKKIFLEMIKKYDFVLVEGIGGLMVPLNSYQYVSDLIKILKIPVILITNNKIGTINHTLLTINICRNLNIPIYGLIINRTKKIDKRIDKNLGKVIKSLTNIKIIGEIPLLKKNQIKNIEKYMNFIDVHDLLDR